MKDADKKQGVAQEVRALALVAKVAAVAREELHELVVRSGLGVLGAMLEADREVLCGPRDAHSEHVASRAGHAPGELAMGGRRVSVKRPRVRSADGNELPLPTWVRFQGDDPLCVRGLKADAHRRRDAAVLAVSGAARRMRELARDEQERGEPPICRGDLGARRGATRPPAFVT